jgi:hypothetical protein
LVIAETSEVAVSMRDAGLVGTLKDTRTRFTAFVLVVMTSSAPLLAWILCDSDV